jgi:hypothetical protein
MATACLLTRVVHAFYTIKMFRALPLGVNVTKRFLFINDALEK